MKKLCLMMMTVFSIFMATGCSNETGEAAITGVNSMIEINLGESFNALEGISAVNEKGKDITEQIVVEFEGGVVEKNGILTPEESGDYMVRYSLENHPEVMETCFLTVKNIRQGTANVVKTFNFDEVSEDAFNGLRAVHDNSAEGMLTIEQGKLSYTVSKLGNEVSDNRLELVDLVLETETTYQYELVMSANQELNVNILVKDEATGSVLAEQSNVKVGIESQTVSLTVEDLDTTIEQGQLVIELGDNEVGATIGIQSINEINFLNPTQSSYSFDQDGEQNGWLIEVPSESQASAEVKGGALIYHATPFSENPWENKIWRNDFTVEQGKSYQLRLAVEAENDMTFTFIIKNGDSALVWSQHQLKENDGMKEFSYMFSAEENQEVEIILELGGQDNSGEGAFKFYSLDVTSYDGYDTSMTKFSGIASINSFEMLPAIADLYLDTEKKQLVYDITSFGESDWHNKVYIDQDVTFKEGVRYQVDLKISSKSEMTGLFVVNPIGTWSPKVVAELKLTPEEQVLTFETDKEQVFDQDMEILFQFGGQGNKGENEVYISEIVISEIK
ncbi:MAG TPA: hypothetical protein DCY20_06420 [Firmicutes bacterium]|nr:hypothetical protein [Bacillota bacterium]